MKGDRWIEHLPLWVALGATVSTELYGPGEVAAMALPLAAAAAVEALRRDLSRHQRWLEVFALVFFLGDLTRGAGLYTVAIHTLYLLSGIRLALPRTATHQRQVLLMGFLLFLTSAIGTTDLIFLAWSFLWACSAALALLRQSWEPSAALHRSVRFRPPYARVPAWVGGALLFGACFFLLLPRLSLGFRPRAVLSAVGSPGHAGLSDAVDLSSGGPVEPNPEVAVRISPPAGVNPGADPQWARGLDLLRGVTLESVDGLRWETAELTPSPKLSRDGAPPGNPRADFHFTPSLHGILALPSGVTEVEPISALFLSSPGGSIRWRFIRARTIPLTVAWDPDAGSLKEPRLTPRRTALLTRLEPSHEAARRASHRLVPEDLPAPELARKLETALRGFAYTLENPSGQATNPLEDFLERTRAGHCEYFASAMALMLRARGVPARVVNGYRLGPWIPEGGYFRVSQNEAHSWVEYWHEGLWRTADPTPQGPASAAAGTQGLGFMARWLDALRYQWDRHVVRFSDEDQLAALAWAQGRLQGWQWRWKAPSPAMGSLLGLTVLLWALWRTRGWWQPQPEGPACIRALRPLLARTRRTAPPGPGDTARTWLMRLAALRGEREAALHRLADAVDAEAYGRGDAEASPLAKAEAQAWRGWKRPTP